MIPGGGYGFGRSLASRGYGVGLGVLSNQPAGRHRKHIKHYRYKHRDELPIILSVELAADIRLKKVRVRYEDEEDIEILMLLM